MYSYSAVTAEEGKFALQQIQFLMLISFIPRGFIVLS